LKTENIYSHEKAGKLQGRLQILQNDEMDLQLKLSRLRQSYSETKVVPLQIPKPPTAPWPLVHFRFTLLVELLVLATIFWILRWRAYTKFLTIYYDPFFPAFQVHPQGRMVAASAAGYGTWTFSDLTDLNYWKRAPFIIWNYSAHLFWKWWTKDGWHGWTGNGPPNPHWVPT